MKNVTIVLIILVFSLNAKIVFSQTKGELKPIETLRDSIAKNLVKLDPTWKKTLNEIDSLTLIVKQLNKDTTKSYHIGFYCGETDKIVVIKSLISDVSYFSTGKIYYREYINKNASR